VSAVCQTPGMTPETITAAAAGAWKLGDLAVARAHRATPAQVKLAWTLQQGPHVLAIPGTGNPVHLRENVAAAALRLTRDDLARLDALRRAAG
jgi:pyridoxine 4-dehydrogenase